jgi:hypothetical protein
MLRAGLLADAVEDMEVAVGRFSTTPCGSDLIKGQCLWHPEVYFANRAEEYRVRIRF